MIGFSGGLMIGTVIFLIGLPILLGLLKMFGIFTIVKERECHVYVLFGNVVGWLDEPGINFLPSTLGWRAFIVNWFGSRHVLNMQLDQCYLRRNPVNSEEGAPMGIGLWYEMYICDPINFLFKNADPRGSLAANVCNSVVRNLSNLSLAEMLEQRHRMSQMVRNDVSQTSQEWGYQLGTVYVRKVQFRNETMIRQIEEKVVNRLRQVTAAITQDGANQVNIITSTADRQAAIEFAKAQAVSPCIVGEALTKIARDPAIVNTLFEVLETENITGTKGNIAMIPPGKPVLAQILAGLPQLSLAPYSPSQGDLKYTATHTVAGTETPPPMPVSRKKESIHEAADELIELAEAGMQSLPTYLQKFPEQLAKEAMRHLLAKKGS